MLLQRAMQLTFGSSVAGGNNVVGQIACVVERRGQSQLYIFVEIQLGVVGMLADMENLTGARFHFAF